MIIISYIYDGVYKINIMSYGFATNAIHAGQEPDRITGAIMTPISMSSTFKQVSLGVTTGYEYSRSGNPTRKAFEDCVSTLENGKWGLAFASGLAATTSVAHLLNPGDEVLIADDVYGGTGRYFRTLSKGIKYKFIDMTNADNVKNAVSSETKMIWLETPTNPTLKISDIAAISKISKIIKDIILVVDNTFATPYFQRPLDLGADLVVHSITKYLNGHSDVVMGCVVGNSDELKDRLAYIQNGLGAVPSPFDCFLALRGIKTLHVRMNKHEENALAIAKWLEKHERIERVAYPGLESHPQHELAKRQMTGFGGMISVWLKGGINETKQFIESLKIFCLAESLGGVESLVEHPGIMTHASVPTEDRIKLGISDNLVRLSVGIESLDDLIADLTQALQ
jgi:cystathionine gamma-lyase